MSRLIHAEFWRLRKNVLYFICLLFMLGYTLLGYLSQYRNLKEYGYHYSVDTFFFGCLVPIGFVFAVFVSLFVGTQYADGAIRNCLIVGAKRRDIYMSSFIVTGAAAVFITIATYVFGLTVGILLLGKPEIPWSHMFLFMAAGIVMSAAFVSIFHMFAMLTSSKTNSAVFCILLSFVMFFVAVGIYQALVQPQTIQQMVMKDGVSVIETVKNPGYLTGFKRTLYQAFLDILPPGQAMQLGECSLSHAARMMGYSALITIITTFVGNFIFCRKDIK